MLAKIGKGILLLIGILMILSVTYWNPAEITDWAKQRFGLASGPRADLEGMAPTTGREAAEKKENEDIRRLVRTAIDRDGTAAIVRTLSGLPSRVVGYPGNEAAAQYVEDAFRSIGLQDVASQAFEVTVPVDKGGSLTVDGLAAAVELFALWPNEVRTSSLPDNFSGTLVDGGKGEFADFNGRRLTRRAEVVRKVRGTETRELRELADAVVLLDFQCGQKWLNAAMLGAKAIVFFDPRAAASPRAPPPVTRGEAEQKSIGVPANIPRFWVSPADGRRLRDHLAARDDRQADCRLRSRMDWEVATTRNVLGVIPGTLPPVSPSDRVDYKRQRIIVLSAFYDSMSVVPRLAPGAESACGLAALLQTARVLKQFPPRHTIVFLATSSHFHCLWGVQHFLRASLPTSGELDRTTLPRGRVDFDLFIGLDLTSHHHQVATTCFGTFFDKRWESNVYRKNLLAPYAKHFTDYAARIFRKGSGEATCPHINAITPPKKTWKNFVPRPVAFDAEAVVARGKDAITLFTPHDVRNLVDTPSDTADNLDLGKLHTQVKTVAALIAKAGRDVQFFTDSKLHLENRIRKTRGNATWFDRTVNPNIPKAPVPGAVVTFRHPAAGVTNAGVRTLYTAYARPHDPHGGGPRQGFYIQPVTLNGRRVTITAWSREIGEIADAEVVIQSAGYLVRRKLRKTTGGKAMIRVAERFKISTEGPGTVTLPDTALGPRKVGRWHPEPEETGKRSGWLFPPDQESPKAPTRPGHAHVKVGHADLRGPTLIPADRFEADVDLSPPGALERFFGGIFGKSYERVELAPDDPEIDPDLRVIRSLTLTGEGGRTYEVRDIDVAFGQFEGQFVYPFVYIWQWGTMPLLTYKLDKDGSIIFAQDEGGQGKETYPNDLKHGGGALCVLFRCRPLTILEIVDSRYLTVLDTAGLLGPENSVPQQWGARFIANQSRVEGLTTSAAVAFSKHHAGRGETQPIKVHMGTGLYGIKLLLTNARLERDGRPVEAPPPDARTVLGVTGDEARGAGYIADGRVLLHPTYQVAWDMWVLNEYRLRQLDRYGISNPMLGTFPKAGDDLSKLRLGLHDRARKALIDAKKALAARDYERFMSESRRAWGYEAKAYPDVASQADDTVKGVVFYFVLLIPFAFFMERLIIGAADIRKRIAGFAVIFLLVFVVLRLVHPAFKLSSSPYIILLAFIILAMGVIVLFIVVSKFNEEIRKMKQAASGVQQADVGRLSASYAAVMLGISNLRKRKVRTTLTAVTLTLLTFTVLSFTSINTTLGIFRLRRNNEPAYEGGLVRDRNWRSLQSVVLDYVRSEFGGVAAIAPRSWVVSKSKKEKEFFEFAAAGGRSNVNGIVGLTPQETRVDPAGGPPTMLTKGSRWFQEGDEYVCILPDDVAGRVGITPEMLAAAAGDADKHTIRMLGHQFTVIGLLDSEKFNQYRDIDDEKLTPVDTLQEAAKMDVQENPDEAAKAPIQAFTHIESSNTMLIPYGVAVTECGGTLRSIAVSHFDGFRERIRRFMERVALNIFVAEGRGEEGRVEVLSSIQTTGFSGVGNLFVPILIAALIVLNTMTGSVYERFHEIHIYSSVGLAPTHIAALFLAEAAVFATVGAVAGYLLGQTVAGVVLHFNVLGAITLNYSSLSTIYSSVVVMLTVFLSTLYPAKKASDMAVPDVTRRWEFPPPVGDDWTFDFPFTVGGVEILGMYAYLARFLQSYGETSIGAFYTEDVALAKAPPGEAADYVISARTWLAPYDLGISQDVRFEAVPTGEHNVYAIVVRIHRISGDTLSWQRMNRGFLNVLRKQFLVWRTVPSGTKAEFADEGRRVVGEAQPQQA